MKKKFVPVLAAGALIVVIICFMLLGSIIEKYTPSKEHMNLSDYYNLSSEQDVALILNNQVLDAKGKLLNGTVYLDYETVRSNLNDRFYWDHNENKLLYTTATDLISADADSTSYYVTKDSHSLDHAVVKADAQTAYIAIDFLKLYSDFSYEVLESPNRVILTTAWGDYTTAPAKQKTQVRQKGGIKSPILADIDKNTEVTVLETGDTWTKISTADGIIGYVKYAVFHRIGVEICPFKRIGQQHGQLSVCVRDNALEQHFGQRTFHAGRCLPAVSAKRHELANHAVIKRWDMISLINGSVYADANTAGQMHGLNGARTRTKFRVLCIDAALNRMSQHRNILLHKVQLFARCNTQLPSNQIQTGNFFRNTVFYLNAGVHLAEIKILLVIHQKFYGARAGISRALRESHCTSTHFLPLSVGQKRRRRFFDQLLMTPLNRALSIVQMYGVSGLIRQNLHFDMARLGDVFFDI